MSSNFKIINILFVDRSWTSNYDAAVIAETGQFTLDQNQSWKYRSLKILQNQKKQTYD